MEGGPDWIVKIIEKGGDVSECMVMLDKVEQMRKTEQERKERAENREFEKVKLEHTTKMRELDLRERELGRTDVNGQGAVASTPVKVSLPKYVEGEDIEVFLHSFERLAVLHKWHKSEWPIRVVPQLSGKALQAYSRMSIRDSTDYDQIKKVILERFGLNSWAYREKYRHVRQEYGETFREYSIRVANLLEHWVDSEKVEGDYGKLVDLILREQLMFSSNLELQVWLRERQPESAEILIDMAGAYQLAHQQTGRNRPNYKDGESSRSNQNSSGNGPGNGVYRPPQYREQILHMAHDPPFGGHLGNHKTRKRIMNHFYWPGIFRDVAVFCRACPQCQKGMPKGRIGKVSLIPIPPMEVPFKRIAMDIVGPLPRTVRGNKFILVICDYATKYPEAVPLKTIDSETVANELIWFMSRVGIPQEILTDMGSNFNLALIKELCKMMKINKIFTSPYHPQANGLVQNFNGTLKKMLRCYSQEQQMDWDMYLPYVLFAYREVPHETTGYSPFDLLYSWPVRGPLSVLHEMWVEPENDDSPSSVLSYIIQAREKFQTVTQIAKRNEERAKGKQKLYFDRLAKNRSLTVGEKALILLPTATSKLLAQWKGPYKVVEKVGDVNYKVQISRNKIKLFHINMLKRWEEREEVKEGKTMGKQVR